MKNYLFILQLCFATLLFFFPLCLAENARNVRATRWSLLQETARSHLWRSPGYAQSTGISVQSLVKNEDWRSTSVVYKGWKGGGPEQKFVKLVTWREYSLFNNTGYIHGPAYMIILQEKYFWKKSKSNIRRFVVSKWNIKWNEYETR